MVQKYVDTDDTVLITDEYKGYNTIIEHVKIDHQKLYLYKGINTNSIDHLGDSRSASSVKLKTPTKICC